MATPRKRWVTIETRIIREPWPLAVKWFVVALGAHMIERWASEGISFKAASTIGLSAGDLLNLTCQDTIEDAKKVLSGALECTSMRSETRGAKIIVRWSKWAEIQGWGRPAFS